MVRAALPAGYDNPNARLLADQYAACGWTTYVPDLMAGDSLPVAYEEVLAKDNSDGVLARVAKGVRFVASVPSLIAWMTRHGDAVTQPRAGAFLAGLRGERGVTRVGVLGYCWGGHAALVLAAAGKVDAVAPVHPSSSALAATLATMRVPSLWALGGDDAVSPSEATVRAALARAPQPARDSADVVTYPGCSHGFALRGNLADAVVSAARTDVVNRTSVFFAKWL